MSSLDDVYRKICTGIFDKPCRYNGYVDRMYAGICKQCFDDRRNAVNKIGALANKVCRTCKGPKKQEQVYCDMCQRARDEKEKRKAERPKRVVLETIQRFDERDEQIAKWRAEGEQRKGTTGGDPRETGESS